MDMFYFQLSPRLRQMLVDYFRPYNEAFYKLAGKDFGWER